MVVVPSSDLGLAGTGIGAPLQILGGAPTNTLVF